MKALAWSLIPQIKMGHGSVCFDLANKTGFELPALWTIVCKTLLGYNLPAIIS